MTRGRRDWCVEVSAVLVHAAAVKKWTYHAGRVEWWKDELDQAETNLRESGVDFRSNQISGGYRTDVVIDPERKRRVDECREKIERHQRMAEEYDGYARFLEWIGQDTVSLQPEDVIYFDLKSDKK